MNIALPFLTGVFLYYLLPYFPYTVKAVIISILLYEIPYKGIIKKGLSNHPFPIVLFSCLLMLGIAYPGIRSLSMRDGQVSYPLNTELFIGGDVASYPDVHGDRSSFDLDAREINVSAGLSDRIRLSFKGRVDISKGDSIIAQTRLKEPRGFLNTGSYNPGQYLKRQGINAVGFVKNIEVIKRQNAETIGRWIYEKREYLSKVFERSFDKDNSAFMEAMIIGRQGNIDDELRDAFSASGVAHLLSISGTHFGLLSFLILLFIRFIIKSLPHKILLRLTMYITPTQLALLLSLPILIFYLMLSGGSIPALRSFIMIFLYMIAVLIGRQRQWLNALGIAALIILLIEPWAIFDVSFQLSFLAVFFMGYTLERWGGFDGEANLWKRALLYLKDSILITLSATLGTAPIMAYNFHQFSLISPISNLIITPFVCFLVLPLGLLSSILSIVLHSQVLPFGGIIDTLSRISIKMVRSFASIPYSNLRIPSPSVFIIVFYYISAFLFVKGRKWWMKAAIAIPMALYIFIPVQGRGDLRVTFFDVGQGDSSLIELPDGRNMLIDGGGIKDMDIGRRVIAPELWNRGIKKVDFVVMSHPHPDHYKGLLYILRNFKVGEFWDNGRDNKEAMELYMAIAEKRIFRRVMQRGDMMQGRGYSVYCLHPYSGFYSSSTRGLYSNQNSESLVLKIDGKGISVLLPGDIEQDAEDSIISLGRHLKSDVIKVPHHGGRTSSTEEFLALVLPKIAVASVGKYNPFNHPNPETIKRYSLTRAALYETDRDGEVQIMEEDGRIEVRTYWDMTIREAKDLKDEFRNLSLLII